MEKLGLADLKWFDLKRYENSKALGLVGWYNVLMMRFLFVGHMEPEGRSVDEGIRRLALDMLAQPLGGSLEAVKEKLIVPCDGWVIRDFEMLEDLEGTNLNSPGMESIAQQFRAWNEWAEKGCLYPEPEDQWPDLRRPRYKVVRECRGRDDLERKVWINLGAPDELLLAEFSNWLKEARKDQGLRRGQLVADEAAVRDWIEFRALEYIDLTIYSKIVGKKLTSAMAGDVLFSDALVDRPERVRKVVRPLAEKLLSDAFIGALGAQAARESKSESGTL